MSYSIIKADLKSEKQCILDIWKDNSRGILDKKYEWIYESNPAGPAQVWLVKHEESGECIGLCALFSRRFVINGKAFVAGIAGDLFIKKEHRSVGPAIMLQRNVLSAIQDGTVDFIYGFPNKSAELILKRTGYKILGERERLVKVLKTAPQLSKLPFGKYWTFLSPVSDFILRVLSFETRYYSNKEFVCEEINDFDERFDLLWEKKCSQFMIMGERTANYLRWRFLNAPNSAHKIFAVFDAKKEHAKGYIIYRFIEKSIEIRDFLFNQNKKTIFSLMAGFLRHARSYGVNSIKIELLKNDKIVKLMEHFGFAERKNTENVLIFFSKGVLSRYPFLRDMDSWLLLESDSDM